MTRTGDRAMPASAALRWPLARPRRGPAPGPLHRGCEFSDAAKSFVSGEFAHASWLPSNSFDTAVGKFAGFHRNPGAATAPRP